MHGLPTMNYYSNFATPRLMELAVHHARQCALALGELQVRCGIPQAVQTELAQIGKQSGSFPSRKESGESHGNHDKR